MSSSASVVHPCCPSHFYLVTGTAIPEVVTGQHQEESDHEMVGQSQRTEGAVNTALRDVHSCLRGIPCPGYKTYYARAVIFGFTYVTIVKIAYV